MICYLDRTFCVTPGCICDRTLTDEMKQAAKDWWGSDYAPISVGRMCKGLYNGTTNDDTIPNTE